MWTISIYSLLFSLLLSLSLTTLAQRPAFKIVTFTPRSSYLGGLSVFLAFAAVVLFISLRWGVLSSEVRAILAGAIIIVLLGLWDDYIDLTPAVKFLGQALAVTVLIVFGLSTKIAFIGQPANILVTFLWMFAIINAFNLLDIMDGLCCGVAVIAGGAFLVICLLSKNIQGAILCSSLIGAGLGFLRYNLPEAKIYLGDTGSMFLGFILASIAIVVDYAPLERKIALFSPILVLGLPIFDTGFVILMRLLQGRAVIRKSRDHFALRLLQAGLTKPKILLLMYIFGLFFAASALIVSQVSNRVGMLVLIALGIVCSLALVKIGAIKIDA